MKNKAEEKIYLDLFKKHYTDFPHGTIKPCERPDFLIIDENKTIGIELTKIYQKSNSKLSFAAQDSIANDILKRISKLLQSYNHNDYEIHLILSIDRNLKIKERDIIAKNIYRLIEERILTSNVPSAVDNNFEDLENFPEEVNRISIYKIPDLQAPKVIDSKYSWMQYNMEDILQETIDKKSYKVHQYHNCDEHWLLIHTISWSSGTFFNPSQETLNHKYTTKFDRVFFLNSFDKEVNELELI